MAGTNPLLVAAATTSLLLFVEGLTSLKHFGVVMHKSMGTPEVRHWSGISALRTSEPWRHAVIRGSFCREKDQSYYWKIMHLTSLYSYRCEKSSSF